MWKKKYPVIILSIAFAIGVAACSHTVSSCSPNETESSSSSENESSSSDEVDSSSSQSEESSSSSDTPETSSFSTETDESSSSVAEISSSSVQESAESSSSDAIESSSSEEAILSSSTDEISSSSLEIIESSSSEQPPEPIVESSSSEEIQSSSSEDSISSCSEESSSSSSDDSISSRSEEVFSSSSEEEQLLSEECLTLRSTLDTFPQVTELLKCIRKTEKVAFILRHSERDKSKSGSKEYLNDNGRKLAFEFGEKLQDVEDIYFMHTRVYRTMETILKISEGKGQSFSESAIPFSTKEGVDQLETADLEESYMIRDDDKFQECKSRFGWGWSAYSYAAYEDDVSQACQDGLYDADDRLAEFIDTYFTYEKMHNVTIAISHDNLLVPFVTAASKRQVHLQFHQHEGDFNYWINYLTGLAIITDNEGNTTVLPATAMNDPYLRVFPDDN
ncbi:hypothetical protein BGX12_10461 [Fibrobacter sp. UWR4]|uniref:hypothetical protein n=1 Tax=Fibrobacter sp. UWR4 TaxID=1896218 RepID=UPI000D7B1320|nr:hypothetical protein [Fibrobacter sp. UWR4]PWJ69981.1 hypothetical protein BGX12_10461 [Fibrobacter sp. UWR4]